MKSCIWSGFLLATVAALTAVSCVSMEELAPPVSPDIAARYGAGISQATLSQGRHLYVTKCAKCHAPEPIRSYTLSEWEELLPEMNEETNLEAADGEAVRQYILMVLRTQANTSALRE